MASELFNTITGYSVGIPPVQVIDGNGNIVTNVLTNGNVAANNIYGNNYFYANGDPAFAVAGNNTQVQFNNNNKLGASPNFTFDSTANLLTISNFLITESANLGDVGNIKILGGTSGYYLQTDGAGNLSWAAGGGGGGNGSPGGANTQVQFNDSGSFGASTNFTFNKTTNTLSTVNVVANTFTGNLSGRATSANTANTVTNNAQPNITSVGTLTNLSVSGAITGGNFSGNASGLTNIPAANIVGNVLVAETVSNAAQPNITSLGTLTGLTLAGPIISTSTISTTTTISSANLVASSNITTPRINVSNTITTSNLLVSGNLNASNSPNINLGSISNIRISGGLGGYVLSTDGTGNLAWSAPGGGGNGVPGGSNTQVQYNYQGTFKGDPNFTFDEATDTMSVAGTLVTNNFQLGSGVNKFSTISVYYNTTLTGDPDQVLWEKDTTGLVGVDFVLFATNNLGTTRQTSKISSLILGNTVAFNEYSGLQINGGVGSFTVVYTPGDIINPNRIQLLVSPNSSNLTKYNLMITEYAETF